MNKKIIGEYPTECLAKVCDSTGKEIKADHEGRLIVEPVDTENCTIRELEMFKIGFKHGRKVERTKK